MADNPDPRAAQQHILPLDTDSALRAPVIYFEVVPTLGCHSGVVTLMLASGIVIPADGGTTKTQPVAVAHLRCSIASAVGLRDAIDKALLLGAPAQGTQN